MDLHQAKVLCFCLGFVLLTGVSLATGARFETDFSRGELYLVVQWESSDDIVVLNPNFEEGHPLAKQSSLKTIQQQNGSLTEQRRTYFLDPQITTIPATTIKILNAGKIQELKLNAIEIKRQSFSPNLVLLFFVVLSLTVLLVWILKRRNLPRTKTEPVFSKESAVQAAQTSNWALFFEILSSNVPWKTDLTDLPMDQWQQQWQFASREPSSRDRQKIIKLLQTSTDCELLEEVISEEEKILSEVLEKQ